MEIWLSSLHFENCIQYFPKKLRLTCWVDGPHDLRLIWRTPPFVLFLVSLTVSGRSSVCGNNVHLSLFKSSWISVISLNLFCDFFWINTANWKRQSKGCPFMKFYQLEQKYKDKRLIIHTPTAESVNRLRINRLREKAISTVINYNESYCITVARYDAKSESTKYYKNLYFNIIIMVFRTDAMFHVILTGS